MWMIPAASSAGVTSGFGKRSRFSVILPTLIACFGQYCTQLRQPMHSVPKTGLPSVRTMFFRGQSISQVPQPRQSEGPLPGSRPRSPLREKKLREIEARKYDAAQFVYELKTMVWQLVNEVRSTTN